MPKKGDAGGNKKAVDKAKKKIVEDRTFGLKNKNKSKKVQQYVKSVEVGVAAAGVSAQARREAERAKAQKEAMKAAKEAAEMEKASLFKAVVNKTVVPAGVDPKSVLCEFYKAGKCVRGNKCKYSHDTEQARKVAKIDLYSDPRALQQADTMDKWDQAKLEEVVAKKQAKGKLPPTDIVCKYFLDAIENSVYGWFWQCPSGDDCHYRHCLPPGFVLKTKADKEREKQQGEEEEEETLEERIEAQRKALDLTKCTPITLELFQKWKADKEARRIKEVEAKVKEAEKKATGAGMGVMSGRDLFRYDPSLFQDDSDAEDEYEIQEQQEDEEDDVHAKNYDSQAESVDDEEEEEEEEDGEERKGDGEDDEEEEEGGDDDDADDGEERKDGGDGEVAKAASAIDKSLYLDDDVPDE